MLDIYRVPILLFFLGFVIALTVLEAVKLYATLFRPISIANEYREMLRPGTVVLLSLALGTEFALIYFLVEVLNG